MFKSPAGSGPVAAGESCLAGQSQSSVGWLSPLRSPEPPVVATSWKWLDFSSQSWPRQPRAQQHRWHTLGFLEAAYGDSVAVHCPPPPVTCTLTTTATIQLHSIPCLRLIKCVLVLDVTCFIKDRIGIQSTNLQIFFLYSFEI